MAIFWEFSLKQEQNIFYISFKKLYTFIMNKTVFVQMYMRWGNTVTYSVKIYNFSVITSTTSFLNIFLYTNLDTF